MQNRKEVEDINNMNEGIGIGQVSVLKGLQSNICCPGSIIIVLFLLLISF
jgi:hypothetical protein